MTHVDAEAIAERLGLPQEAVRNVQRHGFLRRLDLDDREIRERLWRAHLTYVRGRRSGRMRPVGLTHRTQLVLAVGALCLAIAGKAFGAEQPARPDERLAQAVAQSQQIARDVELRHRLPDGRRLHVAEVTATRGVATLETLDPASWSGRSIPAGNGIYVSLCGRGARRHCAIGAGGARAGDALVARRQALEFARRTLLETQVDLVVVALPQTPTRHVLLLFEGDLLNAAETGTDPETVHHLTRGRLYTPAGLIAFSATEDSLAFLKLPTR